MRVIASLDVDVLEDRLLEGVTSRANPLREMVLVVVATAHQRDDVRFRLARRTRAVLGVHVHTWRSLATAALETALVVPPRVLATAALEPVVADLLRVSRGASRGLPASASPRSVLGTLLALREACVTPEALRGGPEARDRLADLLARFNERMKSLAEDDGIRVPVGDAATLETRALPRLANLVARKRITRTFAWGAYELIGIHIALLRELDRLSEVEVLAPTGLHGAPFRFARRALTALGAASCEERPPKERARAWTDHLRARLERDDDVDARSAPPPRAPRLELISAQGAQSELRLAGLRALALLRERPRPGELPFEVLQPSDIAIVARSLKPYAPYLRSTLVTLGVPFRTSLREPSTLDPELARLLTWLRVLAHDLPRDDLLAFWRSPPAGAPFGPLLADCALLEEWTRATRIDRGRESWRRLRERLTAVDARASETALARVERAVSRLDELVASWRDCQTVESHRRWLTELLSTAQRRARAALREDEGQAAGIEAMGLAHRRILDHFEQFAVVATRARSGAAPELSPEAIVERLEALAAEDSLPLEPADARGVHVLDLQATRGLSHQVVIWMGFHDGAFPRRARPDPWLDDAARASLQERGFPLGTSAQSEEEERLLLALTIAGARRRIVLSRQRSDDDGGVVTRSTALRDVARVFAGTPDIAQLLEAPGVRSDEVPAHPRESAQLLAKSPVFGIVEPALALASACEDRHRRPELAARWIESFDRLDPTTAAALAWVAELERFDGDCGPGDGMTGRDGLPAGELYPSHVEKLGGCPLQFFFARTLRLAGATDPLRVEEFEMNRWGNVVHGTIEGVYAGIERAGLLADVEAAKDWTTRELDALWSAELERQFGDAHVSLYRLAGEPWLAALRESLELDITETLSRGLAELRFEERLSASVDLGGEPSPVLVSLAGRLDRLGTTLTGHRFCDDFKTSSAKKHVDMKEALSGRKLQLSIYRELVATSFDTSPLQVDASVIGVSPREPPARHRLNAKGELRDGVLETLRTLIALPRAGWFPMDPEPRRCGYCKYRRACRRSHAPSMERLTEDPRLQELRDTRRKTTRKPTLTTVRAAGGANGANNGDTASVPDEDEL